MKNTFFTNCLLMNSHISLLIDNLMDKLAFVLSLGKVLEGRDDLDEEERFADEIFEQQDVYFEMIDPFVKKTRKTSDGLVNLLIDSTIISMILMKDIDTCLSFKEDSLYIQDDCFDPYEEDKKIAIKEFCYRLCYLLRVYYWLTDIEIGMQDYGFDSYIVPDSETLHDYDPVDELLDMKTKDLMEELKAELKECEADTEEMRQQKEELTKFIKTLED